MQIDMIGTVRMGGDMVQRLLRNSYTCVVYDHDAGAVNALVGEADFADQLLSAMHYQIGGYKEKLLLTGD